MIYKHGDRDLLKNWRPITLLNCDYKIVAKCFAERIKPHLSNLIMPDQKGYIKGRYINEANRLLKDIIDYTDREKNDGIIIFLDQTKAFDRCEWPWIQRCLEKFNFGPKFTSWIMMLLKSAKTSISTNGFLSKYFPISRSIKQGCPVAPLLYILQAEPMACGIRQNDNIVGIQLPAIERPLTAKINQFVDDTQLFVQNETSLPHIFNELSNYEKASGAKMNKDKTVGLCIGTLKGKQPEYKEIKWTNTNIKTLGVYHGYSICKDNIWRDKINKIKCALHVWKSRNLTLEGKLLLLKTFAFSIITFELEVNGIPEKILY